MKVKSGSILLLGNLSFLRQLVQQYGQDATIGQVLKLEEEKNNVSTNS